MTAFRQGPTPWFRVSEPSRESPAWMARGVERDAEPHAWQWAADGVSQPQQQPRDPQAEFVRDAIQRSYQ